MHPIPTRLISRHPSKRGSPSKALMRLNNFIQYLLRRNNDSEGPKFIKTALGENFKERLRNAWSWLMLTLLRKYYNKFFMKNRNRSLFINLYLFKWMILSMITGLYNKLWRKWKIEMLCMKKMKCLYEKSIKIFLNFDWDFF